MGQLAPHEAVVHARVVGREVEAWGGDARMEVGV